MTDCQLFAKVGSHFDFVFDRERGYLSQETDHLEAEMEQLEILFLNFSLYIIFNKIFNNFVNIFSATFIVIFIVCMKEYLRQETDYLESETEQLERSRQELFLETESRIELNIAKQTIVTIVLCCIVEELFLETRSRIQPTFIFTLLAQHY